MYLHQPPRRLFVEVREHDDGHGELRWLRDYLSDGRLVQRRPLRMSLYGEHGVQRCVRGPSEQRERLRYVRQSVYVRHRLQSGRVHERLWIADAVRDIVRGHVYEQQQLRRLRRRLYRGGDVRLRPLRLPERRLALHRIVRQQLERPEQLRGLRHRLLGRNLVLRRQVRLPEWAIGVQRYVRQHVDQYEQLRDLREGLRHRRIVHEWQLYLWK